MTKKSSFQSGPNGPLTEEAVDRLKKIKGETGLSYAALGERVGLSGTFLYNLMNKGMNVGTQHIARMESAVERMEAGEDPIPEETNSIADMLLDHTYHLRPDLKVSFNLPFNITMKEAERLAAFIQTLPAG